MIDSTLVGDDHTRLPFTVGQLDPRRGFVHVLDDVTLKLVIDTLDTVSDFVAYLERKERLLASSTKIFAAGEEELLAHYLRHVGKSGAHDFVLNRNAEAALFEEGSWDCFCRDPRRQAQIEANTISYAWDLLIRKFERNALRGSNHYTTHAGFRHQERLLRILARESRLQRRMLARALVGLVRTGNPNHPCSRRFLPEGEGPVYVFQTLPRLPEEEYDNYRRRRREFLSVYCSVVKLDFPQKDIVGISTEPGDHIGATRSEDLMLLPSEDWSSEDQRTARELKKEFRLGSDLRRFDTRENEYPNPSVSVDPIKFAFTKPKTRRNDPCRCGSGRKAKKCCG